MNDHSLATDGSRREPGAETADKRRIERAATVVDSRQLVARTAPVGFGLFGESNSSVSIGKCVGDGPRLVVCACKSGPTSASRGKIGSVSSGERVVVDVAGLDGCSDSSFAVPGTRRLAAVLFRSDITL